MKQIIEILSRGHGEPDAFMRRMICVICWYEGGVRSKADAGLLKVCIQSGKLKVFPGEIAEISSVKKSVHSCLEN